MHLNELDIYAPDVEVGEQYSNQWGEIATGVGQIFGQIGQVKKYNKALKQRHEYYEKQKKSIRQRLKLEQKARKQRAIQLIREKLSKAITKAKTKAKGNKKEIMWVGGILVGVIVIGGGFLLFRRFN